MKIALVFLTLVHLISFPISAQNKLSYALTDFDINIKIDSLTWRKVGYDEIKDIAKKQKFDLDEHLKYERYNAIFHFIPRDSVHYPPTTFITLEVWPLEKGSQYSKNIDSISLNTEKPGYLKKLSGGTLDKGMEKYYFDRHTSTVIFKFLTHMSVKKDIETKWPEYISLPNHFLIGQSKVVRDNMIQIHYHCYETEQAAYFPKFEQIIKSFH